MFEKIANGISRILFKSKLEDKINEELKYYAERLGERKDVVKQHLPKFLADEGENEKITLIADENDQHQNIRVELTDDDIMTPDQFIDSIYIPSSHDGTLSFGSYSESGDLLQTIKLAEVGDEKYLASYYYYIITHDNVLNQIYAFLIKNKAIKDARTRNTKDASDDKKKSDNEESTLGKLFKNTELPNI